MATQSLSLTTIAKTGTDVGPAGTMQTMTTGSGNGSTIPFDNLAFILIYNGTGGTAAVTIKAGAKTQYTARSITIPDQSVSISDGESKMIPASSVYVTAGVITVECDVACEIMAIRKPTID